MLTNSNTYETLTWTDNIQMTDNIHIIICIVCIFIFKFVVVYTIEVKPRVCWFLFWFVVHTPLTQNETNQVLS